MRFSLRDLLLVVAFWAGIACCAAQVGFDNGLFCFAVGVSLLISLLFINLGRDNERRRRALRVTIPFLFLAFLMTSLTLFVEAALLSLSALYFARRPVPTTRQLIGVCMAVTLIGLVCGVIPGLKGTRTLDSMRKAYPVISLVSRLQYERRHTRSTDAGHGTIDVSTLNRLGLMEGEFEGYFYAREFSTIHDHQYELFVRAAGFGVGRMMPVFPRAIERPPTRDIHFDDIVKDESRLDTNYRPSYSRPIPSNELEFLHMSGRFDFLNPRFWGALIEPPMGFSGFAEHAFHAAPTTHLEDPTSWIIERLELVSLLRFDEPRVYVLDHLPRMDQLSAENVPTRPLDEFETTALKKLSHEADTVVSHQGREYRMLGSLRAAKQCVECHSVQRGDLLGAFSYALRKNVADGEE